MTLILTCKKCDESKEAESGFYKHPTTRTGYLTICKECQKALSAKRGIEKREEIREYSKKYREEKKAEIVARGKAYREKNAEVIAAKKRAAYLADLERQRELRKEWQRNNPEKVAARNSRWKKRNSDKVTASTVRRMEHIKRATPLWAEHFFIDEAYHIAKVREEAFGFKWHVDHIDPLRGKRVSGLHVIDNLQVIPAVVNLKKNASFEI